MFVKLPSLHVIIIYLLERGDRNNPQHRHKSTNNILHVTNSPMKQALVRLVNRNSQVIMKKRRLLSGKFGAHGVVAQHRDKARL
jgi:hypothetical protein